MLDNLFKAITSECGLPDLPVMPKEITLSFLTITVPTDGLGPVYPNEFRAKVLQVNKILIFFYRHLFCLKVKVFSSRKFYKQRQNEHMQLDLNFLKHP